MKFIRDAWFMVHGYHYILSAYGFWLPNDPRGSWSDFVGAWELFRYGGAATKVSTTQSVAQVKHDREHRLEMKHHLRRMPVVFTGEQASAIGRGFGKASKEGTMRFSRARFCQNTATSSSHDINVRLDKSRLISRGVRHRN